MFAFYGAYGTPLRARMRKPRAPLEVYGAARAQARETRDAMRVKKLSRKPRAVRAVTPTSRARVGGRAVFCSPRHHSCPMRSKAVVAG